jgi:hypothetical protein
MRGRTVSDVETSSRPMLGRSLRKRALEGEEVWQFRRLLLLQNCTTMSSHHQMFHILQALRQPATHMLETPPPLTALRPVVGRVMAIPFSSASSALSGVANQLFQGWPIQFENIEPACGAYPEKTDPLPSIDFTLETPQLYQGKVIMVMREVGLSCQTYEDDYGSSSPALSVSFTVSFTHAVLRYGLFSNSFGFRSLSSLYDILSPSRWIFCLPNRWYVLFNCLNIFLPR